MAQPGGQTIVDRLQAAIHTVDGSEMAKTVCKASTHEIGAPKRKHLDKLQQLTREQNVNQPELLNLIVLRTKEKSWIVVLKALVTCHHLMIHGNERLLQCAASRPILFSLDQFNDSTSPNGYDMSMYIRRYSTYLNKRALAYRKMACDFCKLKKGKDSIWNKMTHTKLNKQIPELQSLLDSLMQFKSKSNEFNNAVINSAFQLLHRDLMRLYATYNDAMIVVFKSFYEMKISEAKLALDIYKKFLSQLEEFKEFFELAERLGCVDKGEVPDLSKAPKQLLEPFQEHIKNGTPSSGENSQNPSPSKSSKVASPINFGDNGGGAGASVQEQVLKEEAAALERFKTQKKQQNGITTTQVQQLPSSTTISKPPDQRQQQPQQQQTSYTEDLLCLGNEIGFGQNIVQQAQPAAVTAQTPQNAFDPFSMNQQPQQQQPPPAQQQNNMFGMMQQQQNNNPFNMPQQAFQQQPVNPNPFGNPFSGSMMPTYQAPLPNAPVNNSPFGVAMQPNVGAAPTTMAAQQPKDPFADLLQPTQGNNLFAQNNQPTPQSNTTAGGQKQVFGSNIDDTLANMMNFDLVGNNNNKSTAATNPNNPFAF